MNKMTLLAFFLLLAGLNAKAQIHHADPVESLRDLKGVYVIVQLVDLQPEGLATNVIQKLVKTTLTDAGITVDESPMEAHGNANLSVTVATAKQPQLNVYVFTVEIAVTQDVQLTREAHGGVVAGQTWRKTVQGITLPTRIDVIQNALGKAVNSFVADYRTVNPGTPH